jgi:intracellular sulfur oxidation DsrE/DsrF family protein
MNRRIFTQAAALGLLVSLSSLPLGALAQTATGGGRHKVVIQMSDGDAAKWNLALNNAKNLQDDVGAANVDIELVAYGPGIGMLKMDAPTNSRVAEAMKAGVKVLACKNTMRNMKLTKDDMHPAIGYVPAGVTEIMRKQSEGWAYLRP